MHRVPLPGQQEGTPWHSTLANLLTTPGVD
jgi:hypothetical protein